MCNGEAQDRCTLGTWGFCKHSPYRKKIKPNQCRSPGGSGLHSEVNLLSVNKRLIIIAVAYYWYKNETLKLQDE